MKLSDSSLESDDAKAFLAQIPTIGELVPSGRIAEFVSGLGRENE